MNGDQSLNAIGAPTQARSVKFVDIEPLLIYLELLGSGTWASFDEAVKAVAPDVWSTYDVADRLAAQAFVEFDWFADRTWQFCRPTLVEAPAPSSGFLGERDALPSAEMDQDCWAVFGASRAAALSLVAKYPRETWLIRNKSIAVGHVTLTFERIVIIDRRVQSHLLRNASLSLLDAFQLRQYRKLLPDLQQAAHYWRDGGAPAAAEIDRLEQAWDTQFFRSETGRWESRKFDRSYGMWRSEGSIRRYYLISAKVPNPFAVKIEMELTYDIFRVAPELGRWFEALKTRTTGKARIKASSRLLEIELGLAVLDLPVLYERWLALSGCRRYVLRQRPKTLRFTNIFPVDAKALVGRLHLVQED